MSTNILSLPLAHLAVTTGNNEDWVDSIKYIVAEDETEQVDLAGISFDMQVRWTAPSHEVVLTASTEEGKLAVGLPPDIGFLLITIPIEEMKYVKAAKYVADIIARADGYARKVITMDLTIVDGITRWPSPA